MAPVGRIQHFLNRIGAKRCRRPWPDLCGSFSASSDGRPLGSRNEGGAGIPPGVPAPAFLCLPPARRPRPKRAHSRRAKAASWNQKGRTAGASLLLASGAGRLCRAFGIRKRPSFAAVRVPASPWRPVAGALAARPCAFGRRSWPAFQGQAEFATAYRIPLANLRQYEIGRHMPPPAVRATSRSSPRSRKWRHGR